MNFMLIVATSMIISTSIAKFLFIGTWEFVLESYKYSHTHIYFDMLRKRHHYIILPKVFVIFVLSKGDIKGGIT